MSTTEAAAKILDIVEAEMVECVPPAPEVLSVDLSRPQPEATPVQQSMDATLTQTGAGPPPEKAT